MAGENVINIAAPVITDARGTGKKTQLNLFYAAGRQNRGRRAPGNGAGARTARGAPASIPAQDVSFLGQFTDIAANEPGYTLIAEIFAVPAPDHVLTPAAEIEEVMWFDLLAEQTVPLAPLTQKQLLPLLLQSPTVN